MSDLVLRGITKSYGGRSVRNGLSHTFPEGVITCISGESGCGKTTLLKILAGFEAPDGGSIEGLPKRIAFVFQEDRLCEDFSALSNIRLVCGKNKSKDEILRHLGELGLREELKKPLREYSGGMKRRVAIARAICYDADLILLDEPFKGLDAELRKTVMDYVKRHTAGKTVLCVTHDPMESDYLGGMTLRLTGSRYAPVGEEA